MAALSVFLVGLGVEHGQQGVALDVVGVTLPGMAGGNHTARMRGGVDVLEFADRDLRVNLRGGQVGVAQHGLDEADVGPVLQHQGRHRVAEQVAGAGLADASTVDVVAHQLREPVRRRAGDRRPRRDP